VSQAIARRIERGFFAAAAVSMAVKISLAVGAPRWLLDGWLALAVVLAVLATVLSRGGARWLDGWRLVLVVLGAWQLPSVYPVLGGDGPEYYVLARSLLFDRDLDLANDFDALGYAAVTTADGSPVSRVQIGLGLLWLPFLLFAHAGAQAASWLGASVAADGFSPLYQSSVTLSSFLYAFTAVILLERMLRRHYPPGVAVLACLAIWQATPLHFYAVANPSMSHAGSAFAATLFFLAWLRARETRQGRAWAIAGAAGALMSLIRAHDSVLLAMPLVDLLASRGRRLHPALAFVIPCGIAVGAQTLVWYSLMGPGFAATTAEMNWLGRESHWLDLLFSSRHGLFTWTPIYLAAPWGWLLWRRRDSRLAWLMMLGFAASVFLNGLFIDWWGSNSFGQRRLLGLTPLFVMGIAEAAEFASQRPLALLYTAVALVSLWNMQFSYIYNSELVAGKDQAVSLGRLIAAQVQVTQRDVWRSADWLPPRIWTYLYDNLEGVWLDEGPWSLEGTLELGAEPAHVLPMVGSGWYEPEQEAGVRFRRSRGRRSLLHLPIRRPRDSTVRIRARRELDGAPVALALAVNGAPVGEAELLPGWREYAFFVPGDALRHGRNDILFTFSATPRSAEPDFRGRNVVMAVDFVKLVPVEVSR
jgi:hypothetical protein